MKSWVFTISIAQHILEFINELFLFFLSPTCNHSESRNSNCPMEFIPISFRFHRFQRSSFNPPKTNCSSEGVIYYVLYSFIKPGFRPLILYFLNSFLFLSFPFFIIFFFFILASSPMGIEDWHCPWPSAFCNGRALVAVSLSCVIAAAVYLYRS